MKDMQETSRETTRYYVQWQWDNKEWRTPTDQNNTRGWDTAELAALAGIPEVLQYASKTNPPPCRIVRRTIIETVED
jgi:hypothetical protein